jgi:hypothetical protein
MLDVNSLLIGAAILVVILSIWALGWITIGKDGDTNRKSFISLRLFWIYSAIIFAMLAITLSIIKVHVEGLAEIKIHFLDTTLKEFTIQLAFSCVITAFIMGFVNIVDSTILVVVAGWKNKGLSDFITNNLKSNKNRFIILAGCAGIIFVFSSLAVIFSEWFVIGIFATVVLLLHVSVVCR